MKKELVLRTTPGFDGILLISDGDRWHTARVGEDGIKTNTPYRVVDGKFVEAKNAPKI